MTYDVMEPKFDSWTEDAILVVMQELADEFGLVIKQNTTLRSKKGSVHCHLGHVKHPGIIEVTVWPRRKEVWVDMHNNRRSNWNEMLMEPVSEWLARRLGGRAQQRASQLNALN